MLGWGFIANTIKKHCLQLKNQCYSWNKWSHRDTDTRIDQSLVRLGRINSHIYFQLFRRETKQTAIN